MTFNPDLKYSKSHEWVRMDGDVAVIGISDFAQDALGDLVFVNLPQVGDDVTAGEAFGDVESVKAVSDLMSPVTGTVCEINEELLDPEQRPLRRLDHQGGQHHRHRGAPGRRRLRGPLRHGGIRDGQLRSFHPGTAAGDVASHRAQGVQGPV